MVRMHAVFAFPSLRRRDFVYSQFCIYLSVYSLKKFCLFLIYLFLILLLFISHFVVVIVRFVVVVVVLLLLLMVFVACML